MRNIPAGEFKAKCLALMDEIHASGEGIIVTKRGRPVARVLPSWVPDGDTSSLNSVFGFMRGVGVVQGDIVGPIVPAEDWSLLTSAQGEDTSL